MAAGTIITTNPPTYPPPLTEQHVATHGYDGAGHTTDWSFDGTKQFHAQFDPAGRLLELTGYNGELIGRWTYDGCGRPP